MGLMIKMFAFPRKKSVFKITIDTTKIVSGATNGSENPLTFRIPMELPNINNACIIRVSDGRSDISISATTPSSAGLLTFASSGIYTITIIGKVGLFNVGGTTGGVSYGYDKNKIMYVDNWGYAVNFMNGTTGAFDGCVNMTVRATNTLVLPVNSNDFFRSIKGFDTSLTLLDTSKCTTAQRILATVMTVQKGTLNPFWKSIVSFISVYNANTFATDVDRIEIISDTLETLNDPWALVTFQNTGTIRLICKTPNLKTIFRIYRNGQARTRCHLGEVDVRNVTTTTGWANGGMTPAQVDPTLLGWANNLPFMQAGVTWDWGGSTYSNNPAVIAAYNKITVTWGVIFTNLTMA